LRENGVALYAWRNGIGQDRSRYRRYSRGQVSKPAHTVCEPDCQCAEAAKDSEARGTTQNNQYDAQYWLAIAQPEQGLLAEAESTVDSLLADQPEHQAALAAKASLSSQCKEWPASCRAKNSVRSCAQNRRPNDAIWAMSICQRTI